MTSTSPMAFYVTEADDEGRAVPRLFLAVQHPAEDSETLDKPSTRWLDFADNLLPRPSVVAIIHKDGLDIGA